MKSTATPLAGAVIVELQRHVDERGFFARTWCSDSSRALLVPPGMAHGFLTVVDRTELDHQIDTRHARLAPRGV